MNSQASHPDYRIWECVSFPLLGIVLQIRQPADSAPPPDSSSVTNIWGLGGFALNSLVFTLGDNLVVLHHSFRLALGVKLFSC